MKIDENEWLRRENYFLREQNEKLRVEIREIKNYLEDILKKIKLNNDSKI